MALQVGSRTMTSSRSCDLCQAEDQYDRLKDCDFCQTSYCENCAGFRQKLETMGLGKGLKKGKQSAKCILCEKMTELNLGSAKTTKNKNTTVNFSGSQKKMVGSPKADTSGTVGVHQLKSTTTLQTKSAENNEDSPQLASGRNQENTEELKRNQDGLKMNGPQKRQTATNSLQNAGQPHEFGSKSDRGISQSQVPNSVDNLSLNTFLHEYVGEDLNSRSNIHHSASFKHELSNFESNQNVVSSHKRSDVNHISQSPSSTDIPVPTEREGWNSPRLKKVDIPQKTDNEKNDSKPRSADIQIGKLKQEVSHGEKKRESPKSTEVENTLSQGTEMAGGGISKSQFNGAQVTEESISMNVENDFGEENSFDTLQKGETYSEPGIVISSWIKREEESPVERVADDTGNQSKLPFRGGGDGKPNSCDSDSFRTEMNIGKFVQGQNPKETSLRNMRREHPMSRTMNSGHYGVDQMSEMMKPDVASDQNKSDDFRGSVPSQVKKVLEVSECGQSGPSQNISSTIQPSPSKSDTFSAATGTSSFSTSSGKVGDYSGDQFSAFYDSSFSGMAEDTASVVLMDLLGKLDEGVGSNGSSLVLKSVISSALKNGVQPQTILNLMLKPDKDGLIELLQLSREKSLAAGTSSFRENPSYAGKTDSTHAQESNEDDLLKAFSSLLMLQKAMNNIQSKSESLPSNSGSVSGEMHREDREFSRGASMLRQLTGQTQATTALSTRYMQQDAGSQAKKQSSKYSETERSDLMKVVFGILPMLTQGGQRTRLIAYLPGGGSETPGSHYGQGYQENDYDSPYTAEKSDIGYEGDGQNTSPAAYALMMGGYGDGMTSEDILDAMRKMVLTTQSLGFQIRDTSAAFGDCMFIAVVDQLQYHHDNCFGPLSLRLAAVDFLRHDPYSEDGTHLKSFLDGHDWDSYLNKMSQQEEWGDHIVLSAIANVTGRTVQVIHSDESRDWTVIEPKAKNKKNQACIYLGHVAQLHYVSLRPSSDWKNFSDSPESGFGTPPASVQVATRSLHIEEECRNLLRLEHIDDVCGLPIFHLSYLMKRLMNKSEIREYVDEILGYFSVRQMEQFQTSQKSQKYVGSGTEGLLFSEVLYFYSSGKDLTATLSLTFLCEKPRIFVREPGDAEKAPSDYLLDTSLVHPGYSKLIKSAARLWGCYGKRWEEAVTTYYPNYYIMADKMWGPGYHGFNEKNLKIVFKQNDCETYGSADYQYALCSVWPEAARKWITRRRRVDWPPENVRDEIVQEGCHLIPLAHKHSLVPDIEWRFCFASAEKKIASEVITFEQRYCFLILKGLCQEIHSLTSGHLKSVFFTACENIEQDHWEDNPAGCVMYMIQTLLKNVQQCNLPNYFIPENNMIDDLEDHELQKLAEALQYLRQHPLEQLQSLGSAADDKAVMITEMVTAIQEDVEHFRSQRNTKLTVTNLFIPLAVSGVRTLIRQEQWKKAAYLTREIIDERKFIAEPDEDITLENIVPDLLIGLNIINQWWFCLHINRPIKSFVNTIFASHPCKTLGELIGPDCAGQFAGLLVPVEFHSFLCTFCCNFCHFLYYRSKYNAALPILHFCVERYKQKVKTGTDEEFSDFTSEMLLTVYTAMFYVYSAKNQLTFFEDYMKDIELLVEELGTPEANETLAIFVSGIESDKKAYEQPVCNCPFHRHANQFQ